MSSEYLTMAEIEKRYPNEWVLIDRPKTGRSKTDVLGGYVIVHASNRSKFYQEANKQVEVKDCAILYMGQPDNEELYLL